MFRGRIDFRRDLHPGDSFRVLFDKDHSDDAAKILAVSFTIHGRNVNAYRSTDGQFYDEYTKNVSGNEKRQFLAKVREYKRTVNNFDLENNKNSLDPVLWKILLASIPIILFIGLASTKKPKKTPNNSKKKIDPIVNAKTKKVEHSDMVALAKAMAIKHEDFYYINFRAASSDGARDFLVMQGEKFDFGTLRHPYISTIPHCDNLVLHLCNLIYMAVNSIHDMESEGRDFLNILYPFNNRGVCGLYTAHDAHILHKMLMDKIAAGEVNWGVFNDLIPNDSDDDPSLRYIRTTVIHSLFCIEFITIVKLPNIRGDAYHVDFNETYVSWFCSPFSKNKSRVKINYIDANNVRTERNIIEAEHVIKNGVHYLKGFCLLRFAERLFRFDRICFPENYYPGSGFAMVFHDSDRDDFFTKNNLKYLIPAYQARENTERSKKAYEDE